MGLVEGLIVVTQNEPRIAREQARCVDAKSAVARSDLTRDLLPAMGGMTNGKSERVAADKKPAWS